MKANEFSLPQGTISFSHALFEPIYTLVTGGRPPAAKWLKKAQRGKLWAIDRGIDIFYKLKCVPDFLLGDFDSAAASARDWAIAAGVLTERFSVKKDLTDTQLALAKIKEISPRSFILLTGAFGARFDHAMSTLFSCAFSGLSMILADEKEACFFLHGEDSLSFTAAKEPKAISLFSLTCECRGIYLEGTAWPLKDAVLRHDMPYAVSNELSLDNASFRVFLQQGTLAIYLYWS